jgi:hypothetical protein
MLPIDHTPHTSKILSFNSLPLDAKIDCHIAIPFFQLTKFNFFWISVPFNITALGERTITLLLLLLLLSVLLLLLLLLVVEWNPFFINGDDD